MQFSNTLIKASAGSGKTFQLSNRYLQLVFYGAKPETILATTFTRKAAGEILDRIFLRLADAATDENKRRELSQFVLVGNREGEILSQAEVHATLALLTRNIHRLRVSTLDSFFQRIAGNLSLELGMPAADWRIMETDDRSPLLLEGIRELLVILGKDKTVDLMHLLFKGETRSSVTREINSLLTDLAGVYDESNPDAWQQLHHRAKPLDNDEVKRLLSMLEKAEIARTQERVDDLAPRLLTAVERQIAQDRNRADHVAGRLLTAYQALRKPLLRGYAIVRDEKGKLVTDAAKVKADAALSLEFHDGKVHVVVPTRQGKLF